MKTYEQIKAEVADRKARQYRESADLAAKAGADLSVFGDIEDVTCQLQAWLDDNDRTLPATIVVECSRADAIPMNHLYIENPRNVGGGWNWSASLIQMVNRGVITLKIDKQ